LAQVRSDTVGRQLGSCRAARQTRRLAGR